MKIQAVLRLAHVQVIQLENGDLVMDTRRLKTEPEDLSLQGDEDDPGVVRLADNRDINTFML